MSSRPSPLTPRPILLALTSAVLLVLSFPNFNQVWCAWIALIPWLALVRGCAPRASFGWSWGIAFLFFLASLWWLTYVSVIGWILLSAVLAVFLGVFGWVVARYLIGHVTGVRAALLIAAAWVAVEFLRSYLFSGLGWNLLAYSQTPWLPLIQIADVTTLPVRQQEEV